MARTTFKTPPHQLSGSGRLAAARTQFELAQLGLAEFGLSHAHAAVRHHDPPVNSGIAGAVPRTEFA